MFSNDRNIEKIATLVEEIQQWSLLRKEQAQIEVADKLSSIITAIATIVVVAFLALLVCISLSIALAYAIEPAVGSFAIAFLIIAGIDLLLLILAIAFSDSIIKKPLLKNTGFAEGNTDAERGQCLTDINNKEKQISQLWDNLFHEEEQQPKSGFFASPTQRFLDVVSSSAAIIDGVLLGWKLYKRFKRK
jgi:energy-coupling factor transporter transmembrane protein EcfT